MAVKRVVDRDHGAHRGAARERSRLERRRNSGVTSSLYPEAAASLRREQRACSRLARFYGNIDMREAREQQLIDRAKANGRDIPAIQAALDAFEAAAKQAQPVFASTKGIAAAHQGFAGSGNVVDPAKALQTVLEMRSKLKDVGQTVRPASKALREAIFNFRITYQPEATPRP